MNGIALPSFDSVKCSLYTARKTKLKVEKTIYKEVAEVEIPATFEDFLLADYQNGDSRIIIFATNDAKSKMKTIGEYFCDATFKSVPPPPFAQLFSIHDFEISVTNAIKSISSDVVIKKCYFHFCNSLWRKAKSIGKDKVVT
ncbi:uncharacterized protein LOC126969333 [Leptidea sinapis]|uniref:uncharacterized protein LOC126969333 n=1 Tax=Leptidea sinapis TaxID=189913 RepID=UPI0021C29666|nr:uncharacterized protein LOC126969333 [Leptidea sinapis]